MQILFNQTGCGKSIMAKFQRLKHTFLSSVLISFLSPGNWDIDISGLEAAIMDLPHPVWSDRIYTNPIRLLDLENAVLALEFCFYLTGKLRFRYFRFGRRHIGFTTSGLLGQHFHLCYYIVWPRKCRFSSLNFVSISLSSWDIVISCL